MFFIIIVSAMPTDCKACSVVHYSTSLLAFLRREDKAILMNSRLLGTYVVHSKDYSFTFVSYWYENVNKLWENNAFSMPGQCLFKNYVVMLWAKRVCEASLRTGILDIKMALHPTVYFFNAWSAIMKQNSQKTSITFLWHYDWKCHNWFVRREGRRTFELPNCMAGATTKWLVFILVGSQSWLAHRSVG